MEKKERWRRKRDEYRDSREACYARLRVISRESRNLHDENVMSQMDPDVIQERRKRLSKERREVEGQARKYRRLIAELDANMGGMDVEVFSLPSQVRLRGLYASQIKPHLQAIKPHETKLSILNYTPDPNYKDKTGEYSLTILFANDDKLKEYLAFSEWTSFFCSR